MSANNRLEVVQIKNRFVVFMNCCVDNDFVVPKTAKHALYVSYDKVSAIMWAHEHDDTEYGISVNC